MSTFTTTLPAIVYARPRANPPGEWREIDLGPGIIHLPDGEEIGVRLRNIGDDELEQFVSEAKELASLTMLNLSENRSISDEGMPSLTALTNLKHLNLSSCGITNRGLEPLKDLAHLENLDLSYCNRLNDRGVKLLGGIPTLKQLSLQGCIKVTHAGVAWLRRAGILIKE